MHNFCVVYCLIVALCLVVCVYANAEETAEGAAKAAVEQAKASVTEVRARAQSQLESAKGLLEKVELYKNQATQASSQSQATATGNPEAVAIEQKIKSLSQAVDASYSDEKGKLVTAVGTLTSLLQEAQGLDDGSNIEIKAKKDTTDDFTETNQKAKDLKDKATEVDNKITAAVAQFNGVDTTVGSMAEKAKEAQLKDAHVSAIVAVATINTILGNAATIIGQIEGKKNEVSVIVDEMKKLKKNPTTEPDANIKALLENADNALTAATDAVDSAKIASAAIQRQKDLANAALTNVKEKKQEVSDAQKDASTAEACVATATQSFLQLQSQLQIADNSLTNVTNLNQKLQTALSTTTSKPGTEQSSTHSQVKPLQDSVSADVKAIQSMMGEADRILQETEKHKQEVHDIVQEMQKLKTTANSQSNDINELCKNAEGELTKANNAVAKAKTEKEAMRQEKLVADDALKEVNTAAEIVKAQQQAETATSCLEKVKGNLSELRSALRTAENSVANANDLKQKLKTIISTTTTAPRTKEVKETEKANPPEGNGTEPDQKDTTTQPEITDTIQPASKDSLSQNDNSTDKLKDTLSKVAQNVPTTALTGEKAPAPGAKNDSAMTVSVPLLVVLIAYALLQ